LAAKHVRSTARPLGPRKTGAETRFLAFTTAVFESRNAVFSRGPRLTKGLSCLSYQRHLALISKVITPSIIPTIAPILPNGGFYENAPKRA
jgi:hypothetical protein